MEALAAVIVPNIGKFIGTGEDGAKDAEAEAVQTAMNGMMAEMAIIAVTARNTSSETATQDWSAYPQGADTARLSAYLQNATTTYYYCYDGTGQLVIPVTETRLAVESALACGT